MPAPVAENPYAPPRVSDAAPANIDAQAELRRRPHLRREGAVRTIGLLLFPPGFLCLIATGTGFVEALSSRVSWYDRSIAGIGQGLGVVILLVLAALLLATAIALRLLHPAGRVLAAVCYAMLLFAAVLAAMPVFQTALRGSSWHAGIGAFVLLLLIAFPCAVGCGFQLLLWRRSTHPIFHVSYRPVLAATPHLRPLRPWWHWPLLLVVLGYCGTAGYLVITVFRHGAPAV